MYRGAVLSVIGFSFVWSASRLKGAIKLPCDIPYNKHRHSWPCPPLPWRLLVLRSVNEGSNDVKLNSCQASVSQLTWQRSSARCNRQTQRQTPTSGVKRNRASDLRCYLECGWMPTEGTTCQPVLLFRHTKASSLGPGSSPLTLTLYGRRTPPYA